MIHTKEDYENMRLFTDNIQPEDRLTTSLVIFRNPLGEILHVGKNKVVVSGSAFTMMKHYNLSVPVRTPSYNNILGLEHTDNTPFDQPGIRREEEICLFAVGVGGCGQLQHEVYPVDYAKWISPENLVPFRHITKPNDLSALDRSRYFGRKVNGDKTTYYFKRFESEPELLQRYVDGTPIGENVHTSTNTLDIESFVQLKLIVSVDDCREWFRATTGIDQAKINTLSLLTAYKTERDGHIYYQDIRPMTRYNFPSEPLNQDTKDIHITYLTFY